MRRRMALGLVAVVVLGLSCLWIGGQIGRIYEFNHILLDLPPRENLSLSLSESFGRTHFHSQEGQDKWVAHAIFPGVRNGYYVDVGSGDGVGGSNTKVFDELGWKGVCIDPFPSNMRSRTCQTFKEVVYSETGHKVQFRAAGGLGGIEDRLDRWKEDADRAQVVEFTTVTLDDLLGRAGAPHFINYMSIDVEGAEYEVLKGFSLDKYQVGAFTIEHNYEEPKRTRIKELLESKGYRRVRSVYQDDWYVSGNQAGKFKLEIQIGEISPVGSAGWGTRTR
jgi:FkbM family methyltransferase